MSKSVVKDIEHHVEVSQLSPTLPGDREYIHSLMGSIQEYHKNQRTDHTLNRTWPTAVRFAVLLAHACQYGRNTCAYVEVRVSYTWNCREK